MKTLFILLCLSFCLTGNAQSSTVGSIKEGKIATLKSDLMHASTLNGQSKYKESQILLKKILHNLPGKKVRLKRSKEYNEIEVNALYELGYNLLSLNQLDKANEICSQAIKKSEASNDTLITIEAYNLSGLIHKRLYMLDHAIEQYQKAMHLSVKVENNHRVSQIIMNNIASIYNELGKDQKALEMGRKMMLYFPIKQEKTEQSHIEYLLILNTVGVLLDNVALSQNSTDTLRIAINKIKTSTPVGLKMLLYTSYAKSLNNLERTDSAQYYYKHALALIPQSTNPYNVANLHYLYGCLLKNRHQKPQQASHYFSKAANFYRKNPNNMLVKCLEEWADLEATTFKNNTAAYALLSEAHQVYRKNTKAEYQSKLSGFDAEFRTREKEIKIEALSMQQEVEQTKHQMVIITILANLLIATSIVLALLFLLRKKKSEFKFKELSLQHDLNQKRHEIETLSNEMSQKMTERYINGLEDSNKRISSELHDGICNKLLALHMNLRHTSNDQLIAELASLYNELRILSHELASPEFQAISLNQTLEIYIGKFKQANLFELTYYIDPKIEAICFDQSTAREIYRIIQEALTNIMKHADAQSVCITISENQGGVEIMIEDDGKGYDAHNSTDGIGLRMMKERVVSLNATLSIETTINKGTLICVSVPL